MSSASAFTLLNNNDYVHVFAFDFSKAFDTVSHASLNKLAQFAIPDSVYNWIIDFFETTPTALSLSELFVQSPISMPALFRDRR